MLSENVRPPDFWMMDLCMASILERFITGMHTVLIGEDDPQADYISLHQFSASLL